MSEPSSAWFERLERTVVHDGWLQVARDRVRTPDGEVVDREVVLTDDAVAVVPVMADGTVVLLRQYRHPIGGYLLELPAGKRDVADEDPEETARRELAEETALTSAQPLVRLTTFVNSAGMSPERTSVYLAVDVTAGDRPEGFVPDAEEADMEIVRLPFDAAVAAVHDGTVTDAKTVIGLLLARTHVDG